MQRGWLGVVMHFRGCSGEPNRNHRIYHSGETEDGTWFLHWLKREFGPAPTAAVGYSLGGNMLGCLLAESGAEISRVEESVYRLLQAYQGKDAQVFAIPSCLIVSLMAEDGRPVTRMRRISAHGTDLELLESCNALCRQLCRTVPPLDEARAMVDRLPASCRRHRPATVLLGYGIAPAFFCPLFGGGFWDSLSAFFCGLVVGTCLLFGGRWLGSNSFLRTLVCSGIASLLSLLLVRAGLGNNVDLVTIGVLMLLVPGVALTNAMDSAGRRRLF